jgi:Kef-type K+ transport system membrane component KefB
VGEDAAREPGRVVGSAGHCDDYAWAAEYVGAVAAITGAYVAGVLIAQTEFKKEIDGGIHPLAYSIFVPVFFISIGLQANGRMLGDRVAFTLALVAVAVVAKALGCALFARWSGFSNTQSVRVGHRDDLTR